MHRLLRFWRRLLNVVRPHAREADLAREIAAHLALLEEEYRRRGFTAEEAHRQAGVALGGVERIKELHRAERSLAIVDDFLRDVQIGVRMMRRQRGTTVLLALTVALGIGTNTAVFSLIETVFLRPLPVRDPYRLVLFNGDPGGGTLTTSTPPDGVWNLFSSSAADFLRDTPAGFESVAAFSASDDMVTARAAGGGDVATRAVAHLVSGNYFGVLGIEPEMGRALTAADDRLDAPPVASVSDHFWRDALRADPRIVGSTVIVNKTAVTIVGVMPPEFFGVRVRRTPDLWLPLRLQPDVQLREPIRLRPDYYWLNLIGRLAPGRTREAAQTATTDVLHRFLYANAGAAPDAAAVTRIRETRLAMVSGARGLSFVRERDVTPLSLLFAVVGLLLLLACANVATLLLCRAHARRTEVAVRRALGAGRGRLIRQWLTESLMLAVIGASGGLLLARWVAPLLETFFPSGPVHATLNGTVLAFATGAALLASLLFGVAPALYAGRVAELGALRSTGRGSERRRRLLGARDPLVVAQIAVSLVLVLGATLFARTLFNLEREPLGFDQDNVLLVPINPRTAGYTPANVGALYRRLYDEVAALPGVETVTFARFSPFSGHTSAFGASIDGYTPPPGTRLRLETVQVGPNYPQTLGMPLLAGRAINLQDTVGTTRVAMVNEAFVRRFSPHASPVGHHLRLGTQDGQAYEIVGVIGDASFHNARSSTGPFAFIAMLQVTDQMALDCEIELRTRSNAAGLGPRVRQTIAGIDGRLGVTQTPTLRMRVLDTFGPERVMAGFVSVLAALGLIVAAVGLYGVVSHGVTRRTKEIGVRISLGASRGDVLALLGREIGLQVGAGLVLGVSAAAIAGRAIESQLFGVSPRDPTSLAIAAAILTLVAGLASLVPALRALRVHPSVALRAE